MPRYVLDAPTLLQLVATEVQVSPRHQLVAPNLIRSQALSLLLKAVRSEELTEAQALAQHDRLTELKMRLLGDRVSRRTAWKIAREQGWETTYDAEYIAVTKLQADALITVNPALAAKAKGLVALAPLKALFPGQVAENCLDTPQPTGVSQQDSATSGVRSPDHRRTDESPGGRRSTV
ncbi:MAG: type II toxin-antitoxin system VapC family toxin [Actinomycetota bacterium]|nr:type II toxin-antitoxin system VapC family toxin [Actinomycetota bacterium]